MPELRWHRITITRGSLLSIVSPRTMCEVQTSKLAQQMRIIESRAIQWKIGASGRHFGGAAVPSDKADERGE